MPWKIEYKKSIVKTVRKLDPQVRLKLKEFLEVKVANLDDPRSIGKPLISTNNIWRYRMGNYRVLCEIKDTEITILVLDFGHRSTIYR